MLVKVFVIYLWYRASIFSVHLSGLDHLLGLDQLPIFYPLPFQCHRIALRVAWLCRFLPASMGTSAFLLQPLSSFLWISSSSCISVSDGGSASTPTVSSFFYLHLYAIGISLPAFSLCCTFIFFGHSLLSINHFCKLSHAWGNKKATQLHALLCVYEPNRTCAVTNHHAYVWFKWFVT